MAKLHLKIVTPEEEIYNGEVDDVYLNTPNGEIGILPHHTNLMSQVSSGELRIKKDGKVTVMATGGGLLQMTDNTLSILTDLAKEASLIDEKIVEEAKERALKALEQKLDDEEYATTLAVLEKSLAQLKVKRRYKGH